MIAAASAPVNVVRRARDGMRRAALRRRLEAVRDGKSDDASVDFEESGTDLAEVVAEVARRLEPNDVPMQRLVAALKNSGAVDRMVDRLEAPTLRYRAGAARALGALGMYETVGSVAPLLAAREKFLRDASARALGRIGGTQSAEALLAAIQRGGLNRRLVAELARAAPDQFIEPALSQPLKPGMRPALALAAGLRRRRSATTHLMALVQRGTRRERVISCRALGWIGAYIAVPVITTALNDRDWRIRVSAAKALGALRADSSKVELRYMVADRNPRVRKAADRALRRMGAA